MDINKLIIIDFKHSISKENLNELKEIAKKERTYLNNRYHIEYLKNCLDRKANEIAFKTTKYQDYSDTEKMIIANNIVFDNQKFAALINNSNFDIKSLQAFLKIISYLKSKNADNALNEKDKLYLEKASVFAKKLAKYFNMQIGVSDLNIIINKLCEVLSFEPELITEKSTTHTR